MWCLRYWAVVPLLPFPTASPLFQLLWLVSMLAASRPCLYCAALLICLFLATCHFNQSYEPLVTTCRCFFSANGGRLFSSLELPSLPSTSSSSASLLSKASVNASVEGNATSPSTVLSPLARWLKHPPSWTLPIGGEGGVRLSLGL
ncbi:hypothetical protein BCR35DRAFT_306085 [Leucosporidium creatinivorum]|uniref:Uncharacterized protein n=1 Tax=Leucosporidium creatinivorum TaxID=106004 RepID=A0A1Y2EZ38_9BASI|nr:hypothetical protein BCR35DRAFT_306085 [Leucosporidium creatinivorum]